MNKFGKKTTNFGFYAYINDDNKLVIGEERWREGGDLYTGDWQGMRTPYIQKIREEDPTLFNEILDHFETDFATAINQSIDLLLDKFEFYLPKALYDKIKEDCLKNKWTSRVTHIQRTMDELKSTWSGEDDMVYIPAHYERRKK